jgi:hypothetical protein
MERYKRKVVFPRTVERQVSAFVIKNFQMLRMMLVRRIPMVVTLLCANTWCFHGNSFSSYIVWHQRIAAACRTILVSVI